MRSISFVTQEELDALKKAPEASLPRRWFAAMRTRTLAKTRAAGFVQPGDTQEWWHLSWERASDAAFVWHMEQDEALGKWIHDTAMDTALRDADDWLGPWFRARENPPKGMLETAHVTLALCEFYVHCRPLFTPQEQQQILDAIREKGMIPCGRYCADTVRKHSQINNWYCVLLTGYGVAACVLQDEEALQQTALWLPYAHRLFQKDSYGESMQYSNYASLTLSHLQEVLLRNNPEIAVDLTVYANLVPWYAYGMLQPKPLQDGGPVYPRTMNFADSAMIFRPTADVLMQVSARLKDSMPQIAALANWVMQTTYSDPNLGDNELSTFGFYNHFRYHALVLFPQAAKPLSPAQLQLPLCRTFDAGQTFLRDRWENPGAVLGVQGGYGQLNVASHRHEDHLSFQLAVGKERMLIDSGHCCYRLYAYRQSCSTELHSVFELLKQDGTVIRQHAAMGNFFVPHAPLVKTLRDESFGDIHVLQLDGTDAYRSPDDAASGMFVQPLSPRTTDIVVSAQRVFISCLPHGLLIIDRCVTSEPTRMRDHFALNNRENLLQVHEADAHRLVFRRGGEALKLFECAAQTDGADAPSRLRYDYGYVHVNYHPLPNREGQGKEGSSLIYCWDSPVFGKEHLRVYGMAFDREEAITGWHIYRQADCIRIESPQKQTILRLLRQQNSWLLDLGEKQLPLL